MKYWSIIIVCVLIFSGCGDSRLENGSVEVINLSIKDKNETPSFYDIFEKVEIIYLETNEKSLIGGIEKLVVNSSGFFILDRHRNGIFHFDLTGKFIRLIGNKGKGPGEYKAPCDFLISEKDNLIKVAAPGRRKIIFYSIDGDFIKEISVKYLFDKFFETSKGFALYSGQLGGEVKNGEDEIVCIREIDSEGSFLKDYKQKLDTHFNIIPSVQFAQKGDTIRFVKMYDNRLYEFTNRGIYPIRQFNFGSLGLPRKLAETIKSMTNDDRRNSENRDLIKESFNYIQQIDRYLECEDYAILTSYYKRNSITSIRRKDTFKEVITFSYENLFLEDSWERFYSPYCCLKDTLFSVRPAYLLLKELDMQYSDKKLESIRDICRSINLNSNPCIFKYVVKNDINCETE